MFSVKPAAWGTTTKEFHFFTTARALSTSVCVCVCVRTLHKHTEQSRKEETPFSFVRVSNKKK